MRFSIQFLLINTAIIAGLAFCVANLTQTTLFIACAVLPAVLALTFRVHQNVNHGLACLIALGAAIIIGSGMLAYWSYDATFNHNAQGILVGGGWGSVVAAAIVGAILGFVHGLVSLAQYAAVALAIAINGLLPSSSGVNGETESDG